MATDRTAAQAQLKTRGRGGGAGPELLRRWDDRRRNPNAGKSRVAKCGCTAKQLSTVVYVVKAGTIMIPAVSKSIGAKGDFGHFLSSEQHADGRAYRPTRKI